MRGAGSRLPSGWFRSPARGLPFRRGLAVGEEGLSGDLRHLTAGGVIVGPEVRAVGRRDARLERPTAGIAVDDPTAGHALDVEVEGAARRRILEGLPGRGFSPACGP